MKVPRDVNAGELIKLLKRYGYTVVRQTGSHIRLIKRRGNDEHNITIPNHKPIKIGTLQGIAKDICSFNQLAIQDFYSELT